MWFRRTVMLAVGMMTIVGIAAAQNAPAPPATARTVVAATKLPTVSDVPLYFSVASVELPAGLTSSVSKANGILYQLSGSTEATIAGEVKMINPGEGLFIGAGKTAKLKAGSGVPSTFLHFFLVPAADVAAPAEAAPAVVKEAYRTPASIPDLRPGGYDLNLTRVTFPAGMPSNAHVLSGTGANTIDGKVISRAPGSFIYEPFDLVHQWGNPGGEPLTFITFNINPEGVPAVLPGTPAKAQ